MAIVRGNVQTATGNGVTSLAVTKPTGLVNGDVLVAFCGTSTVTGVVPTGFTEVGREATTATQEVIIAYKVVTDAGSEPASYTWTGTGGRVSVACTLYTGCDTSTPIDVAASTATGSGSVALSTTTVTDGAMVVAASVANYASAGMTVPASMTEIFNLGSPGRRTAGADLEQATAGSTGTLTFTGDSTLSQAGVIFALRPTSGPVVKQGSASGAVTWTGAATGTSLFAPTNLVATAVASDQIDLTWNAVTDATGYDIERDGVVIVTDHATTSYSDTGLDPNTLYTYRVRAVG